MLLCRESAHVLCCDHSSSPRSLLKGNCFSPIMVRGALESYMPVHCRCTLACLVLHFNCYTLCNTRTVASHSLCNEKQPIVHNCLLIRELRHGKHALRAFQYTDQCRTIPRGTTMSQESEGQTHQHDAVNLRSWSKIGPNCIRSCSSHTPPSIIAVLGPDHECYSQESPTHIRLWLGDRHKQQTRIASALLDILAMISRRVSSHSHSLTDSSQHQHHAGRIRGEPARRVVGGAT